MCRHKPACAGNNKCLTSKQVGRIKCHSFFLSFFLSWVVKPRRNLYRPKRRDHICTRKGCMREDEDGELGKGLLEELALKIKVVIADTLKLSAPSLGNALSDVAYIFHH